MASKEGLLTEGQREMLETAPPNEEILSSSPKSPGAAAKSSSSVLLSEHHVKAPGGGKASNAGIAMRHVRRTHSGKHIRVKKDGAGGKGTWGRWLDTDGESHIDKNDPNYDSGEVSPTETLLALGDKVTLDLVIFHVALIFIGVLSFIFYLTWDN